MNEAPRFHPEARGLGSSRSSQPGAGPDWTSTLAAAEGWAAPSLLPEAPQEGGHMPARRARAMRLVERQKKARARAQVASTAVTGSG